MIPIDRHKLLTIDNKINYVFELQEVTEVDNILKKITTKSQLEYAKMLDDYIYKNIPTNILQGMKLKIENELLERKLKGVSDENIQNKSN